MMTRRPTSRPFVRPVPGHEDGPRGRSGPDDAAVLPVISHPSTRVRDFMTTPVIQVQATDTLEDVAAVLAKYNLLAIPVTDADGKMLGKVTVDDALDAVIPGAWKRRMPRVFG